MLVSLLKLPLEASSHLIINQRPQGHMYDSNFRICGVAMLKTGCCECVWTRMPIRPSEYGCSETTSRHLCGMHVQQVPHSHVQKSSRRRGGLTVAYRVCITRVQVLHHTCTGFASYLCRFWIIRVQARLKPSGKASLWGLKSSDTPAHDAMHCQYYLRW
jgi:hypothetical protein